MDSLDDLAKRRNQSLCQPEAEDQLGAGHQQFRSQSLEEAEETLILEHVGDNAETRFRVLEVAVLNAGLDHIQGSGHNERGAGTAHRGDKVL